MFFTDSGMWKVFSKFARNLGVSEDFISKAKRDFNHIVGQYADTRRAVGKKYGPEELDASLSMQNFYPWYENIFCFYLLILAGFRHTALRELRFYFESSARAYYVDTKHPEKTYEEKVKILNVFKPRKTKEDIKSLRNLLCEEQYDKVRTKRLTFGGLLKDLARLRALPDKKHGEFKSFYNELCDYVHLSETAQVDALRDFGLNLALRHPYYEQDREMLEKTFDYARYLLLRGLEAQSSVTT